MGLDCSRPSQTYSEIYLPTEAFRTCSGGGNCWCDRGPHNNKRYVYVERGGDGRERYGDPFDYMDSFLVGRGGGWPMGWRDAKDWRISDYDRLGEILTEYYNRERGRRGGSGGGMGSPFCGGFGGMGGMMGMQAMPFMAARMMPWMMGCEDFGGRSSGRHHRYARLSDMERMRSDINQQLQHMTEEYQKKQAEHDAFMFGSEAERKQEQYKQQMQKLLQEIWPQLSQLSAMGSASGLGTTPPAAAAGVAANPMMGQQPGMMGMGGMNPMAAGAMGGMGMNGYGGMGGMNSMMNPMMMNPMMAGYGGMGGGYGNGGCGGGGSPVRARRRNRRLDFSGFDDDDGDFPSSFRRRGRRGRGGRGFDFDDDDDFLDRRGSSRWPRRPPPGPPDRGDGPLGGSGGAGATFGDRPYADPRPGVRWDSPIERAAPVPMRPEPTIGSDGPSSPLRQPPIPRPGSTFTSIFGEPPRRPGSADIGRGASAMGGGGMYQSGISLGGGLGMPPPSYDQMPDIGGSGLRSAMKGGSSGFGGNGGPRLAPSREQEDLRGEAPAGAEAGKQDLDPT